MTSAGQRIKQRREELGLSQGQLAKLAGIAQSTLCELESGESKMPSAKALLGLSKSLNVSQAWIISGRDGEIEVLTAEEEQHIKTVRRLTSEQRRAIYELVSSMPKKEEGQ